MSESNEFIGKTIERIERETEMDETITFYFTDGTSTSITSSNDGNEFLGTPRSHLIVW